MDRQTSLIPGNDADTMIPASQESPLAETVPEPTQDNHTRSLSLLDLPEGSTISRVIYGGKYGHVEQSGSQWLYVLDTAIGSDGKGRDTASGADQLILLIRDANGNSRLARVSVDIIDDVPQARDDLSSMLNNAESVSGNVLANDSYGADGRAAESGFAWNGLIGEDGEVSAAPDDGIIQGKHGFFEIHDDGSYTYHLTDADAASDLDEGEFLSEKVSYTIRDGDGDMSTAVLELRIDGQAQEPIATDASVTLELHDAETKDGGTSSASALIHAFDNLRPDAELTLSADHIAIEGAKEAYGNWKAKGNTLVGRSESGHEITIAATVENGEVRLTASMDDPAMQEDGGMTITGISVTATQKGLSATSECLTITVSDTGVSTTPDEFTIDSGHSEALAGNVVDNDDPGADSFRVVWDNPKGQCGTLERGEDGSWTYRLNTQDPDIMGLGKDDSKTERFDYTLIDADGNSSESHLEITITGREGGITFTPGDGDTKLSGGALVTTAYEKYLESGTEPDPDAVIRSGSVVIHADHGIRELTGVQLKWPDWADDSNEAGEIVNFPAGQTVIEMEGQGGIWTLAKTRLDAQNWRIDWTYELKEAQGHKGAASGANYIDTAQQLPFELVVTDNAGQSASQTIRADVVDDVPSAPDYVYSIYDWQMEFDPGENVLDGVTFGADGVNADPSPFNGAVGKAGFFGMLRTEKDGSWKYDRTGTIYDDNIEKLLDPLKAGDSYQEKWEYTARDGEGDASIGHIIINVIASGRPKFLGTPQLVDAWENGLPNGNGGDDAGAVSGSASFDIRADYSEKGQNTYLKIHGQDADGNDAVLTLTIPAGATSVEFPSGGIYVNHVLFSGFRAEFMGGTHGTDWTVTYDWDLRDAQTHFKGMTDEEIAKSLRMELVNDDGISQSSQATVTVHDDIPELAISDDISWEQQGQNTLVSGHIDLSFGADNGEGRGLMMTFDRSDVTPVSAKGELQSDGKTWIFDFGDIKFSLDEATGDWKTVESHRPLYGQYTVRFQAADADGDIAEAQATVEIKTPIEVFYGFFQEAGNVGHNISQEAGKELGVDNIANWVITDNSATVITGSGGFADASAITLSGAHANHTWTDCGTDERTESKVDIPLSVNIPNSGSVSYYVIPAGDGLISLVQGAEPAEWYGMLTLSRNGGKLDYSFDLNEASALVDSMAEGERISLYFTLSQGSGETKIINLDIRGSNDMPGASFDKIQNEVQDGLCNQDIYYNQAYFGYYEDKFEGGDQLNIKDGPDGGNLENTFVHAGRQLGIYKLGNFSDPDSDAFNGDGTFNGELAVKKYVFDESWNSTAMIDSIMDRYPTYSKPNISEYDNFISVRWKIGDLQSFRQYREMMEDDYIVSDGSGLLPAGEYIRFDMYSESSNHNHSWPRNNAASAYVDCHGNIYTDVTMSYQRPFYLDIDIYDSHGTSSAIEFTHVPHAAHRDPKFADFPDIYEIDDSVLSDMAIGKAVPEYIFNTKGDTSFYYLADAEGNLVTEMTSEWGTLKIDKDTGQMTFKPVRDIPLKKYDPDADPAAMEGVDRHTEHFTLVLKDSLGAVDIKDIAVVVRGTNEAPSIQGMLPSHILEEAGVYPENDPVPGKQVASGHVAASDPDIDSSFDYAWSVDGQTGHVLDAPDGKFTHAVDTAYGKLFYNNSGDWEFRLDNSLDAVNSLNRGEHRHMSVTVKAVDEHGASSKPQHFYLFVVGENDAPELDAADSLLLGEVVGTRVVGHVHGIDPDAGETGKLVYMFVDESGSLSQSVRTEIGTLVMSSPETGEFVFLLDMHSQLVKEAKALMEPHWQDGMEVLDFSVTGLDWDQFVHEWCRDHGVDLANLATVRGTDPFGARFETAVGIQGIPPVQLILEEEMPVPVGLTWSQIELDEYDLYGQDAEKHYSDSSSLDISQIVMSQGASPIPFEEGVLSKLGWSFVKTSGPRPDCGYETHVPMNQIDGSFQSIATKYGVLEIDHDTGALKFTLDIDNPDLQALLQGGNSIRLNMSDLLADLDGYGVLAYHTNMYSQNSVSWFTDSMFGDGDPLLYIHDVNISPEVVTPMPVIIMDQDDTRTGHTDIGDPDSEKSGMDYEVYIDGARQKITVDGNGFVCSTMYGLLTFDRHTGDWAFNADGDAARALALGESALIGVEINVLDQETGTKQNSTNLSFLINGLNDAPVANNEEVIHLEDKPYDPYYYEYGTKNYRYIQQGKLDAFDYDITDKLTYTLLNVDELQNLDWGTFELDSKGNWKFWSSGKALQDETFTAQVKISDDKGEYIIADYDFQIDGIDNKPSLYYDYYGLEISKIKISASFQWSLWEGSTVYPIRFTFNNGASGSAGNYQTISIKDYEENNNFGISIYFEDELIYTKNINEIIGDDTDIINITNSGLVFFKLMHNDNGIRINPIFSDECYNYPRNTDFYNGEKITISIFDINNPEIETSYNLNIDKLITGYNHYHVIDKKYNYEESDNILEYIGNNKNICIFEYKDIDIYNNSEGFLPLNHEIKSAYIYTENGLKNYINIQKIDNYSYDCFITNITGNQTIKIGQINLVNLSENFEAQQGYNYTNYTKCIFIFIPNDEYVFGNDEIINITADLSVFDHSTTITDTVSVIFHPGNPDLNGTDDPDVQTNTLMSDDAAGDMAILGAGGETIMLDGDRDDSQMDTTEIILDEPVHEEAPSDTQAAPPEVSQTPETDIEPDVAPDTDANAEGRPDETGEAEKSEETDKKTEEREEDPSDVVETEGESLDNLLGAEGQAPDRQPEAAVPVQPDSDPIQIEQAIQLIESQQG